jgi:hypothetical protein
LQWIVNTIQQLNAKTPPEPTQFPITTIVSIQKAKLSFLGGGEEVEKKVSLSVYLDEVDLIAGISSVGATKNISLVDVFCNRIAFDATLKSGKQWRYLNQLVHSERVILTECA